MRDVFLVGQVTSAEDGWESVIHCSPLLPPGKSSSLLRDEKQLEQLIHIVLINLLGPKWGVCNDGDSGEVKRPDPD